MKTINAGHLLEGTPPHWRERPFWQLDVNASEIDYADEEEYLNHYLNVVKGFFKNLSLTT